jgi:hypothetical protein
MGEVWGLGSPRCVPAGRTPACQETPNNGKIPRFQVGREGASHCARGGRAPRSNGRVTSKVGGDRVRGNRPRWSKIDQNKPTCSEKNSGTEKQGVGREQREEGREGAERRVSNSLRAPTPQPVGAREGNQCSCTGETFADFGGWQARQPAAAGDSRGPGQGGVASTCQPPASF